ncbi:MAG: bifunctional homocysteine S-methyltransferase/methylenetetrahydrofolate reductase [Acidobacteria bacterium]|nr:MAG: bifunctional homocysteine S-methyltransferase/methylenetetrahydrofolate reductase [Acidobacteriota bacterium]REK01941.1 MAG: bifunctional homocysteine S-methyltransferase/methylenetetrahydrofolate reductase [Acidobacteriota bacterium]REK14897.1 MAG: bifunctional homocysteine S-methyltransferase/methylenetetrahydrofolate reductase [Acidobacteriota bacterium]REK45612.1 MAG: bifunctional homocysteine S-methyltransferase/methylenetetrahydrofolate reductase [Acidobacteriota bacterium]
MKKFKELLESDSVYVFDGAIGTRFYDKGVYINKSYDELNLTSPDLVREVHGEYVANGADVIETNTFGATRHRLKQYSLEGKLHEINVKAVQHAKAAAGDKAFVAGAIGPLDLRIEPYGPTSLEEAKEMFAEQAAALDEGGVDLFILETFADLSEIRQAIEGVKSISKLPIIAQVQIQTDGKTVFGATAKMIAERLDEWGADVIGLNCGVGPTHVLSALEEMRSVTNKKLSAQPNAGLPRDVQGRQFYMCSPEYMSKFAKRYIKAGASFIGGCCGTTPKHIRLIADSVRAISPRSSRIEVRDSTPAKEKIAQAQVEPVSPLERSNWSRKVAQGEFVTSVEVLPPKGVRAKKTLQSIEILRVAGVDAVNIPDGPRAQTRMSAQATAVLVEREVGIEAVLHYCCRDRNLLGMMSDLLGAAALGLHNLLIITGDPPKMGPYPDATAVFDIDSIGLTNMVNKLNHGLDLGNNPIGDPTAFSIGVGVNPGAINLEEEIKRFEWKVEAGAEYAITQPVYDTEQLHEFLNKISHVRIPIVAGIFPLVSSRNAEFMHNEVPGVRVTQDILERMRQASDKSKEHAREEGLAIARESLEEIKNVIQGVQVSAPFGNVKYALKVFDVLDSFSEGERVTATTAGIEE